MHAFSISSVLMSVLALASAQSDTVPVTGKLGNAPVTKGNPKGVVYTATLPEKPFSYPGPQGNVKGSISATAGPDGTGVQWSVNFSNLPATGGPFMYHLHVAPVPEDGNCTKTLAHLDPFARGEVPLCNPAQPETCQVGDLSGKFGNLTGSPVAYLDSYTSTLAGPGAFFGNRSIVVHFANKTRITCANFVLSPPVANGTSNGTTTPTKPTVTSTPITYDPFNLATGNAASMLCVIGLAGLTALFL